MTKIQDEKISYIQAYFVNKHIHFRHPQVLVGLLCPLYVMRIKFKSLKEYKLILLTETEFKQVEDEEQTREQEIEQIKTETRRKQSKRFSSPC